MSKYITVRVQGEYFRCYWKQWGWSFVCPVIQRRRRFLGIPYWSNWSTDERHEHPSKDRLARMLPVEEHTFFERAVQEELYYIDVWDLSKK